MVIVVVLILACVVVSVIIGSAVVLLRSFSYVITISNFVGGSVSHQLLGYMLKVLMFLWGCWGYLLLFAWLYRWVMWDTLLFVVGGCRWYGQNELADYYYSRDFLCTNFLARFGTTWELWAMWGGAGFLILLVIFTFVLIEKYNLLSYVRK